MRSAEAAAEYQKLMHESAVRKATLKKDLEYKSTEKQKLEGDIQRSSAELAGYKEELSAVLQYIAKLNSKVAHIFFANLLPLL